jgi:hypothetical protein
MFNSDALKELIQGGGVSFKETPRSFIFACPRCHKKKLYIHKIEGFFCCFRCREIDGFKGRAEFALSEIYTLAYSDLIKQLYTQTEVKFSKFVDLELTEEYFDCEESAEFEIPLLPEITYSPNFVDKNHPSFCKGKEYLINKRGLTEDQINKYDIHYSPPEQSVVFPVKIDNKLVGWQLRHIEKGFKITSTGLDKSKCLMFQDNLNNSEHCILAEGPVSALHLELCGGNVASMGKDVSDTQLEIIKKKVKRLYLALDPDAHQVIERLCRQLYGELELRVLLPPHGYEDVGEMPQELVYEEFKKAPLAFGKTLFYFKNIEDFHF